MASISIFKLSDCVRNYSFAYILKVRRQGGSLIFIFNSKQKLTSQKEKKTLWAFWGKMFSDFLIRGVFNEYAETVIFCSANGLMTSFLIVLHEWTKYVYRRNS